jgi:hypothetical protein
MARNLDRRSLTGQTWSKANNRAMTAAENTGSAAPKTCPSSRCQAGATLLGVVGPNGKVIYRTEPTQLDQEFVETALQGRSPERRFRFASRCVQSGCKQWTAGKCGIIESVLRASPAQDQDILPQCSIRSTCRWFYQRGAAACAVCPDVITDTRDEEHYEQTLGALMDLKTLLALADGQCR